MIARCLIACPSPPPPRAVGDDDADATDRADGIRPAASPATSHRFRRRCSTGWVRSAKRSPTPDRWPKPVATGGHSRCTGRSPGWSRAWPAAVTRPTSTTEVAAILAACDEARIPVTAAGGRSGVSGASVPLYGGVVLDTTALVGIGAVDVRRQVSSRWPPAHSGRTWRSELRAEHGLTIGHFPQSFDLATVGGWVACRGAGQYSTRYGKIEDMVVGLEVVLADGTVIRTGGSPASAVGPDLNQLFTGSEGTLGVVTRVWLRAHPDARCRTPRRRTRCRRSAAAVEACRTTLRRGATPAVLRLYDAQEAARGRGGDGSNCILLVLDEGDPAIVDATMAVVAECMRGGRSHRGRREARRRVARTPQRHVSSPGADTQGLRRRHDGDRRAVVADRRRVRAHAVGVARRRPRRRRDLPPLTLLSRRRLPVLHVRRHATARRDRVHVRRAVGRRPAQRCSPRAATSRTTTGSAINRARFVAEALGPAHGVLVALKGALDPNGILNPGKLGLPSPFGPVPWP